VLNSYKKEKVPVGSPALFCLLIIREGVAEHLIGSTPLNEKKRFSLFSSDGFVSSDEINDTGLL
jgi:hypothetical protein